LPLSVGADPKEMITVLGFAPHKAAPLGQDVFIGNEKTLARLQKLKPTPRPDLLQALKGAGDNSVAQVAFLPTKDTRRVLEDHIPELPSEIGGGSIKVFTRGVQWVLLSVETSPKITLRLTVQTPDAGSARDLLDAVTKIYKAVGAQMRKEFP